MVKKVTRSKKRTQNKGRGKRSFRRNTRAKRESREHMSNKSDPNRHTVIAARYSTKLFLEHQFSASTTGSDGGVQYYDIQGSQGYLPLTNPVAISAFQVAGSINSYALIGDVAATALYPNGYKDLEQLYAVHLVRASKIQVILTPGLNSPTNGLQGTYKLCVFPWYFNGTTAMPSLPTKIEEASIMPYARTVMCTPYNINRAMCSVYAVVHKVLGITRQQYEDDISSRCTTAGTGPPGAGYQVWQGMNWRVMVQGYLPSSSSIFAITTKVTYFTEFEQPVNFFGIS